MNLHDVKRIMDDYVNHLYSFNDTNFEKYDSSKTMGYEVFLNMSLKKYMNLTKKDIKYLEIVKEENPDEIELIKAINTILEMEVE